MTTFNRGNHSKNNRSFGKPRFNNDRPDMHKATCATCGKVCEVPFKPTGSKPVFCKDCFKKNEGTDSGRSDKRSFGRQSEERQMYSAVCANCGTNCQVPFRPSGGRDVFCSRCFENNEKNGTADTRRSERKTFERPSVHYTDSKPVVNMMPDYKTQFEALNAKMDKVLRLLTPSPAEAVPLEVVAAAIVEKKETGEKSPKKTKKTAASKKK